MSITIGRIVCYGAQERWATLPIANLPPDTLKVRRRIRGTELMRVFVKTPRGVTAHIAKPDGTLTDCKAIVLYEAYGMNINQTKEI